jgi:zinc-binding alcohol dehydrogenase family protein
VSAHRTIAVAYRHAGPMNGSSPFEDVEITLDPVAPHDLLVEVRAVSVNPVDTKQRANADPGGEPRVLGFDAAGVVAAVGEDVTLFSPGDEVWYAGSVGRRGSDAALQLVDERIVGHKPSSLDFADAAALPLTSLTASEALDRFGFLEGATGRLLVVGASGGVGSVLIQLARALTDVEVIAAVSRPESAEWVRGLGAQHVVDRHALVDEVLAIAPDGIDAVFSPFSKGNVEAYARLLRPRGAVVAIDGSPDLDLTPLKEKSQTWHWEYMFTRPLHEPESLVQHEILEQVARLVDAGAVRTTATTRLGPLDAATLAHAHALVESSATIGKVVIEV